MGFLCNSLLLSLFLVSTAMEFTRGDVVVSGTVFCDQCKDGRRSLLDYPLSGVLVALECADAEGRAKLLKEETTNWLGSYSMSLAGNPDLSHCYAQVVAGKQAGSTWCGESDGNAKAVVSRSYTLYGVAYYTVDSLLRQPVKAMSFCPNSTTSPPPPSNAPVVGMPPLPLLLPSACPYRKWTMPENRCNWRVVSPDTKVAVAFGLAAAQRYGTDLTLWQGLHGKAETYGTLLREATTALLNSYNSLRFEYTPISVVWYMNSALMAAPRNALVQAFRFKRANSGSANITCHMITC